LLGPRRLVLVAVAFLLVAAGGTAGVVGWGPLSGVSARVARGGWFAIVLPIRDPNHLPSRLQALDAHGRIVAHEPQAG
jgi:catechol 2,3-dioxygenase-like lactoylglutathione lyase family enzyme